MRRRLGFKDQKSYAAHLRSLLALAKEIEQLAPAAGPIGRPNPEYPWVDRAADEVIAPVNFDFPAFDARNPGMVKLQNLIVKLLEIGV